MGLHDTLNCPKWAPDTEQCSLATYLAKKKSTGIIRPDGRSVFVDIFAVARDEADVGRYPFPSLIKLGGQ
jgi:hypothetical protein